MMLGLAMGCFGSAVFFTGPWRSRLVAFGAAKRPALAAFAALWSLAVLA
jgi:hypothetical protein